jgi:hypothetical protein
MHIKLLPCFSLKTNKTDFKLLLGYSCISVFFFHNSAILITLVIQALQKEELMKECMETQKHNNLHPYNIGRRTTIKKNVIYV